MTKQAVVFDVNETMLDLGALDPLFAEWFGNAAARREWFAQTLHYALTLAATREFRSFGEVGLAALQTIASRRECTLPADAGADLRQALVRLPPHPDVVSALEALRTAGFPLAALSNNPLPVLQEQLHFARLSDHFAEVISVDEAGALKPAPEVYQLAIGRLQLPPKAIWMVAAHGWDIAGAQRAGLRGAFVARPGQTPDPFAPPEIVGADMVAVANAIIASKDRTPPE
jgi:2-haloacid dehalogenase